MNVTKPFKNTEKQLSPEWKEYVESLAQSGEVDPKIIETLQSSKYELLNWIKANFVGLYLMTLNFLDVDGLNPFTVFKDNPTKNDEDGGQITS